MSDERAMRAAEAVQDWAETTTCIMSSRAEGIEHQAKLIAAEYADVLAENERLATHVERLCHDMMVASEFRQVLEFRIAELEQLNSGISDTAAANQKIMDDRVIELEKQVAELRKSNSP